MNNLSSPTEFLLMAFSEEHDLQILHAVMFLFIYITALVGNFLIVTTVTLNHNLHSPMYFFLTNLSFLDICYISTTVPKSIAISLTNNKLISFAGCVTQVFLVITCAGVEISLLTVMAYDRYVAICNPLQYRLIMNWEACIRMTAASWISSIIHGILETTVIFRLSFCKSNIIGQFFCDLPQLQKIACSDTKVSEVLAYIAGIVVNSFCFVFIFASYGFILSVVLRTPSSQSRYKAFSTCTPHLTVYSLFMITAVFSYLRPKSLSSPTVDLVSSILYTLLPPVLNPIIYSFRNKDIQKAVWVMPSKLKGLIV